MAVVLSISIFLTRRAHSLFPSNRMIAFILATSLLTRHRVLGRIEDLEESIVVQREEHRLLPIGSPNQSTTLNNLAFSLSTRYQVLGKTEDLEESILLHRQALSLRPVGHPDRGVSLDNLANSLSTQYRVLGRIEDLEESVSMHRQALGLRPVGQPDRAMSLNNLGFSLSTRYRVLGKSEDLEESILLHREAVNLCPVGQPGRAMALNNLAASLSARYQVLGGIEEMEESILLHHEALNLCPVGHPGRAMTLNNLAGSLSIRFQTLGKIEDLDESIQLHHEAVSLCPIGHPDRPMSLDNLAGTLSSRYQVLGKIEDLEESILLHREAASLCPVGHLGRSMSLNNLAGSIFTRYQVLGKIEDLEESILLHRQALSLRPVGHPSRSMSLNNLAGGVFTRYQVLGKTEDLEESILFHRQALSLRPVGHPDRATSLNNLGLSLFTRYRVLDKVENLEESIVLYDEAVSLCPVGHPGRAASLNNLALGLSARYQASGKIKDLDRSTEIHHEVVSLCPVGHPNRAISLKNLAGNLCNHYRHVGTVEDLQKVFGLYKQAAYDGPSFIQHRLQAAVEWTNAGREFQHESIFSAYTTSLQLLNRRLISHSSVESQQKFLATADIPRSLASDAASAAINAEKIELAVEFLEQGRALLWSRVDGYKHSLEELRGVAEGVKLANRFESLAAELEHLALLSNKAMSVDKVISSTKVSSDAQMKRHRLLTEEWDGLVEKIRGVEGFRDFLQTPPFKDLQMAAAEGPIILVNISKYRCDAIILLKDGPPELVRLPEVQLNELMDQKLGTEWEIKSTLQHLWQAIAAPTVKRLKELKIPKGSRIWWCPTGPLCTLPLHAAGNAKRNLQDFYIPSYISTLSSLIKARKNLVQDPATPARLLVVAQPSETQKLEKVEAEADAIKSLRTDNSVTYLFGPDANSGAVIKNLKDHPWVHFACHGHLGDGNQPFQASFELHDRRLPLLDLIRAQLPNAELAFLSACHSAEGDSLTPDENIHLSAALQFCGFRGVIGTLWEMDDEDGPAISKLFYEYMFRDPHKVDFRDSAKALNLALNEMRKGNVPLDRLALFVHTGA